MALRPSFREEQVAIIQAFLRHHWEESGRDGVVLGLSGGLDSSVTAGLLADAIGPDRVLGLALPLMAGNSPDVRDAEAWAKHLGIRFRTVEIGPMVGALVESLEIPQEDRIGRGNVHARIRMIVLYQAAHAENRLVIGTSNKSEYLCGYFTLFGDAGCDFAPLGDLYKTQVRGMARQLGLPERILEKVPSAGLWEGQTDEGELGISYEDLDRALLGLELEMPLEEIVARTGLPEETVERVIEMVRRSIHKRKMPLIPKVGIRTLGLDWRE
ncbi:MAG: NAD+ synthase [Candidatus Thermoplasmatota archaeon]|nr:NAD+ synthase [Candidatus Thermoplasmatota archaeon]